jgi:hypothetical protein
MNKGSWVECFYGLKFIRKIYPCEGEIYIVDPLNPKKKKYRGERVKLIKFDLYGDGAEVLRLDSEWHVKRNYLTKIDICDLKPEKEK